MADTDIIEVKGSNALVPNLTICVDNENDEEPSQVEFQDKIEEVKTDETATTPDVKFSSKTLPNHAQKVYENKVYSTYDDLSPEAVQEKQRKRAQRFSSPLLRDSVITTNNTEAEKKKINKSDIDDITQQITQYNEKATGDSTIRENALCIRGVQDMSTEDIFRYLNTIPAKHIEWINDLECNAVWSSTALAMEAFLLYTKFNTDDNLAPVTSVEKNEDVKTHDLMDVDEFNLVDSDDEDMSAPVPSVAVPDKTSKKENLDEFENVYRKVYKNDEETNLEIKFTTLADRKVLGAGKRSKYYVKHGNPNYGGMKGILSRSYKRKFNNRHARQEMEQLNIPYGGMTKQRLEDLETEAKKRKENEFDSEEESENEEEKEDKSLIETKMKDLSDAISCEIKKSRNRTPITPSATTGKSSSIWSRLGKKPSSAIVVDGPLESKVTFEERTREVDVRKRLGKSHDRHHNR